jgi:Fe-S-cluster-containing dehydrogenase component
VRYGFAIDHRKCIGCHACTVACKSENEVPLGSFRTWVKYLEKGKHPDVRRSFTVLRCNQCEDAPCITICPVNALSRRPDGIVDLDGGACVGCKACLQACPYDALYLNDDTGTAQKCHYCAHRIERGLKPACEVVCPVHAIIGGDLDDPEGELATLLRTEKSYVRKPEKKTRPKVFYVGSPEENLDPVAAQEDSSYLWAGRTDADPVTPGLEVTDPTLLRAVYDVPHKLHWGAKVSLYLLTKSISAGVGLFIGFRTLFGLPFNRRDELAAAAIGLVFLALTLVLLVADLKRPERFIKILTRPNWKSWLVRGSYALMAYGAVLTAQGVATLFSFEGARLPIAIALIPTAALAAGYTGFLFNQARGRDLWLARDLALHIALQALLAGGAAFLVFDAFDGGATLGARIALLAGVTAHILYVRAREGSPDKENPARELARRLLEKRARVAELLLGASLLLSVIPVLSAAGGLLALVALFIYEDAFVRAGQSVPLS